MTRETVYRPANTRLPLRIETGPDAVRLLALPALPCRLGRGAGGEVPALVLRDPDDPPAVSREHALLDQAPDGSLRVTDLSRNGTAVDGHWLRRGDSALLASGSVLQLGPSLILACLAVPEPGRTGDGGRRMGDGLPPSPVPGPRSRTTPLPYHPPTSAPDNLREQLTALETLAAAWKRVQGNRGGAGPDGVTVAEYARNAERRLACLREDLRRGRYQPLPPRLFAAPKPRGGVRTIAILSIQDRVVQHALHAVLQPLIEPLLPPCAYAFRPGRSPHHALRAVDEGLARGSAWVAESDVEAFFDRVPHALLLEELAAVAPDPFCLTLVARCLAAGAAQPGLGLPQGGAASPLLSNLYLAPFDRRMLDAGHRLVRYGDDFLLLAPSRAEAQAALLEAEECLRLDRRLSLRPDRTRVLPAAAGFTFLGYRFTGRDRRPAPEAEEALRRRLAEALPEKQEAVLRGWQAYFQEPGAGAQGSGQSSSQWSVVSGQLETTGQSAPVPEGGSSPSPSRGAGQGEGFLTHPHTHTPTHPYIARFLALFSGRENAHARLTAARGRVRFTPCSGPVDEAALRGHLAGETTLALYLHRTDGSVRLLVLDVDAVPTPADAELHPSSFIPHPSDPSDLAAALAADLSRTCAEHGIPALLEDSGRRGRHLWVFFAGPVPPDQARRLGRLLLARAGGPRPGARVEVFPRHSEWAGEELGDAVKLPLGRHPATGRRCVFLEPDGSPAEPNALLARLRPLAPERLPALLRALAAPADPSSFIPHPSSFPAEGAVARLCRECAVIRAIDRRAALTGHLAHVHNLILLYSAGRLGEEGARFIHRVIGQADNYDPEVCQRYIAGLDPSRKPLTCARIREWLEETGERGWCTCAAARRTPLDGIIEPPSRPRRSQRPAPAPDRLDRAAWQEVAADLFGSENDE